MFPAFLREIRTGKFIHLCLSGKSYSDFFPRRQNKGRRAVALAPLSTHFPLPRVQSDVSAELIFYVPHPHSVIFFLCTVADDFCLEFLF